MPELDRTPFHVQPYEEVMAILRSATNLEAVEDPLSATGWKLEAGPFPGWGDPPVW